MRRVLTFYKFLRLIQPAQQRELLDSAGRALDIKGTILLAEEGVNGTLVADEDALAAFQEILAGEFGPMSYKWSELDSANPGFHRFKVRVKPEVVSLGVPDLQIDTTGEHVSAARWNELLADPDVLVIDTRNTYEVDIGTFPGAVSPGTTHFREFPGWVGEHLDPAEHKQVAMFCTGGIRCEKASALMLAQGFSNVYQLDGGILQYLENVTPAANRWQGECFVFDQRVSVNADLEQGRYQQCFACRHPLSADDVAAVEFEQGVSCPHCCNDVDAERRAGLRERQRQVQLARTRGARHIGGPQEKRPR